MKLVYSAVVMCTKIDESTITPNCKDVRFNFVASEKFEVMVFGTLGRFETGKEYTITIVENGPHR